MEAERASRTHGSYPSQKHKDRSELLSPRVCSSEKAGRVAPTGGTHSLGPAAATLGCTGRRGEGEREGGNLIPSELWADQLSR